MGENGKTTRYSSAAFWREKIAGTGGIISTIARRADCDWHTAAKYCKPQSTPFVTVGQAYLDELERVGDLAESIVFDNMRLAREQQVNQGEKVDTTDAKWYLTMKAKDRGYAPKHEVEIHGADVDAAIERELARLASSRKAEDAGTAQGCECCDGSTE